MSNFLLIKKYDPEDVKFQPVVDMGFGLFEFTTINRLYTDTVELELIGWKYEEEHLTGVNDDPFALTLDQFLSLPLDKAERMQEKAYDLCKSRLHDAWKKGLRQVVVCDNNIIYSTPSREDISNDLVERLAKQHSKACYVFSAPDMAEEGCVWTHVNDIDFYPTLCVYVGSEDSSDSDLIEKTPPIAADFDTGNPYMCTFDANQFTGSLASFSPLEMRRGVHLGAIYTYFEKTARICVQDENGVPHSTVRNVRLMRNWRGSALLQASPNRVGFVGRDLQRELGIKLQLDPLNRSTRILN
jgi:hypothetical protein